ncbi:tRNA (uridine(34)/cytosine(34)/5-carboxymethylaminomethyluridine(34)-2'-O)-methyltransferase TrmL [Alkalibaculum sp. M08DMB]|uniref:Putative tRNA (cytidine(34)-2'-O)-methyltransferase n=1 Tax=Alkalibaculum sporogenes TaxID=2655001 RepID=A0A6A7K923_9FIRM|nr:tRNA (uridine(34)/cytosine(34)/5-carboxymethylaminomethyluridine(34)-2'-O)-methyltransferase TrmL [Alkalibaculum sporogenes]MPW25924.1 tRNA (uridine(34)/cytosine(34)/5-carboxymethylaminomethyluridine(34)-2'-O)-methyltransferase TrmL [Alkalibaculum sporogenes]
MIHVVLFEPEIPQNTGNIARTCAITGSKLHLIKPLGFSLDDKYLKRAGLDYWDMLEKEVHESFEDFLEKYGVESLFFLTTKSNSIYSEIEYPQECFLVFGKETAGLPQIIHEKFKDQRFKIPMVDNPKARSLNLSNSVNIVLYEALRQNSFPNMV